MTHPQPVFVKLLSQPPSLITGIIIPMLQVRVRHSEAKELTQDPQLGLVGARSADSWQTFGRENVMGIWVQPQEVREEQ